MKEDAYEKVQEVAETKRIISVVCSHGCEPGISGHGLHDRKERIEKEGRKAQKAGNGKKFPKRYRKDTARTKNGYRNA